MTPSATAERHVVTTSDGINLAVDVYDGDSSKPALMLIPGMGAGQYAFVSLVPHLVPARRVITYDPRGVGESEMSSLPWTLEQLVGDVRTVMDAVAATACDVLGASMGGVIAQHLALQHPDVVRRLILAATTPGGPHVARRARVVAERLMGRGATTPDDAYRVACTVLYSEEFQRAHPEFIDAQVAQRARHPLRPRVFSAQRQATSGHDTLDRLAEIHVPTLVMHGTADLIVPLDAGRALASGIAGAEQIWFEGAGHLFFHEEPERTARAIATFLDR